MNSAPQRDTPAGLASALAWLTARRLRGQAMVLAVCLWATCAVDFATSGIFDRAGNVKFQDFLPLYISGKMIAQGRAGELYNQRAVANEIGTAVHNPARVILPMLYGPQVGLLFAPLSALSFSTAAWLWTTASLLAFFVCIYLAWRVCPGLRPHARVVAIAAVAFPPLFHFFVRGQLSVLVLLCFTLAFLALRADRCWLTGIAFGLLVFKPQFLLAVPLILLLSGPWKTFAGLTFSAAAQIALAWFRFGSAVMGTYFDSLWHASRWIGAAEPGLAPIQMHSLRSFWTLLIPWPEAALVVYILSSIVVIGVAAAVWKSPSPLALRFSSLILAAVLTNPHLFVYDLLVLAPAILLLVDWALTHPQHWYSAVFLLLSYLVFVSTLFGPLSRWTHFQLSVPVFVALLWILWRSSTDVAPRLAH